MIALGKRRRLYDNEPVFGLLVLLAAIASVVVTLAMIRSSADPLGRTVLSLVVLIAAAFAASTNWTRRFLRAFGVLGLALLMLLLLDVGRDALQAAPDTKARNELVAARQARISLDKTQSELPTANLDKREAALRELDIAVARARTFRGGAEAATLPDLATRAANVGMELRDNDAPLPRRAAAVQVFEAAYDPASRLEPEVKLKAAVNAAVKAGSDDVPDATAVDASITAACRIIHARDRMAVPKALDGCTAPPGADSLDVAMATVRLRLAKYRQGVLHRPEDARPSRSQPQGWRRPRETWARPRTTR